jgi:hypothetical protein
MSDVAVFGTKEKRPDEFFKSNVTSYTFAHRLMRSVLFISLSLLSLVLSIFCFGVLLISCSGHPPTGIFGMWIIPLSFFGGGIFLYLTPFFWKAGRKQEPGVLRKEAKSSLKKTFLFFLSFIVAAIIYFVLLLLMLEMAIIIEAPDWIGYILYAFCAGLSICFSIFIYRRLTKDNAKRSAVTVKS